MKMRTTEITKEIISDNWEKIGEWFKRNKRIEKVKRKNVEARKGE